MKPLLDWPSSKTLLHAILKKLEQDAWEQIIPNVNWDPGNEPVLEEYDILTAAPGLNDAILEFMRERYDMPDFLLNILQEVEEEVRHDSQGNAGRNPHGPPAGHRDKDGRRNQGRMMRTSAWQIISQTVQSGREINTRTRDLLTGKAFLRHGSHSDDSARLLEKYRKEDQQERTESLNALERMAAALEKRQGEGKI